MANTKQRGGLTFVQALTLLFIGLKLTDTVDWSWWWVFAPMLSGLAVVVSALLGLGIISYIENKNS